MHKVKIDVPGYEAFDGFLGTLEFKGGVSVRDATELEIKRIGANIRITKVGTNEQVGPATSMVHANHVSAVVEVTLQRESDQPKKEEVAPVKHLHTEASLTALADKGGIKALRKVAAEYGVKGVSIVEMTAEILEAQAKAN